MAPIAHDVIERFKKEVGTLFLRRALEGPLSDDEEARLADAHAELWEQVPETARAALEAWIDEHKF